MIETLYRVKVSMVTRCDVYSPFYSNALEGHDILYEIQTRTALDEAFERDFIAATNKSFNAQTDGYNGEMFADFTTLADAKEAEAAMEKLADIYTNRVKEVIEAEEAELNDNED